MKINGKLTKAILEQLDKEYPSRIENQDFIAEKHKNREEVIDHLFYLKNRRFIEFNDRNLLIEKVCCSIRITMPEGRTLLKSLS